MNLLTIKNLTKEYTDRKLFDKIDFGLEEGEKVGVIGINGTGKSTFLKIIAGVEEGDEGEYVKGNNVVINYLPQNPEFQKGISILEYVLGSNDLGHDNYGIEGEAKNILGRLGFDNFNEKVDHLSGGQKKKVALAATLLSKNELLILDEPTNHLDNQMTEWLEEWLRGYKGALIMVTHDRYFLDLVCNRIVELDKGKLYSYKTNYEGYLALKAEREEMALATQDKHANILRKELAWMQRGARARSTKQKAHIARYEALAAEEKIEIDAQVQIEAISSRLGKKTIELDQISKSFGDKNVISDFSYIFLKDDRIGILGPNGCGKTTLIKIITGQLEADLGKVDIGETVNIGYYAQEIIDMNPDEKVIDYIRDTAEYIETDDGYISASQLLERFLFNGTMQHSKIGKLSGGEKRRLYLAKVLMGAPNVLILDEPTNDLDISTLCILEDYLDTFPGILITVSHDRYFLDRVVRRMLTFENGGRIKLYNGSYTEYYQERRNTETGTGGSNNVVGANAYKLQKEQNKKLRFTYNEQREYDSIEGEIADLEEQIAEYDREIANPKIQTDFIKLSELTQKKEEAELRLLEKMDRYMYLDDLAQKIAAQS